MAYFHRDISGQIYNLLLQVHLVGTYFFTWGVKIIIHHAIPVQFPFLIAGAIKCFFGIYMLLMKSRNLGGKKSRVVYAGTQRLKSSFIILL
jgi:hypothetical protein